MKANPVKVIEDSATRFRVVLINGGVTLRQFTDSKAAASYARGWNQLEPATRGEGAKT